MERPPEHAEFEGKHASRASGENDTPRRRSDAPLPTIDGERERDELVTFDQERQDGDLAHEGRREQQPFGYPLLACSVLLIAAIFYHLPAARAGRGLARIEGLAAQADARPLLDFCRRSAAPLAEEVLWLARLPKEGDPMPLVEARLRLLVDADRVGMAAISVITNIAPMLGILGTAWGLVGIFGVFGSPGAQEGIASGIATALYTTIFGLAIAVPGVITLTCFERALERRAARISALFTALLAQRDRL